MSDLIRQKTPPSSINNPFPLDGPEHSFLHSLADLKGLGKKKIARSIQAKGIKQEI